MTHSPAARVNEALAARRSLTGDETLTAYRVFNGAADGIAGLAIDRFGDVLVVQLHQGRLKLPLEKAQRIVESVHERFGTRAVYKKVFVPDRSRIPPAVAAEHRSFTPWIGEPVEPQQVVTEYGLRFIVRAYDGFSVGLFLEHRENRRRIRELAAGRRVLNGFAYTCGFSVAAVAGGAAAVDSVDLSKRYLEWGKRNFDVNHLDPAGHRFFCSDIFDFYKRARRQHRRYDLIVLDPPTFSRLRRPRGVFILDQQLGSLCAGAVKLLDSGGFVFLSTNHRQISRTRLEQELAAAAVGRPCAIIERPDLPVDFAGDPDYSKSVIARFD